MVVVALVYVRTANVLIFFFLKPLIQNSQLTYDQRIDVNEKLLKNFAIF